jgi:hypothetical protein
MTVRLAFSDTHVVLVKATAYGPVAVHRIVDAQGQPQDEVSGIRRTPNRYRITHVASGLTVRSFHKLADARTIARRLAENAVWSDPDLATSIATLRLAGDILNEALDAAGMTGGVR